MKMTIPSISEGNSDMELLRPKKQYGTFSTTNILLSWLETIINNDNASGIWRGPSWLDNSADLLCELKSRKCSRQMSYPEYYTGHSSICCVYIGRWAIQNITLGIRAPVVFIWADELSRILHWAFEHLLCLYGQMSYSEYYTGHSSTCGFYTNSPPPPPPPRSPPPPQKKKQQQKNNNNNSNNNKKPTLTRYEPSSFWATRTSNPCPQ